MKLNKIVSLCKREKRIVLFNRRNDEGEIVEQWIGDGTACYLVGGLPIMSAGTCETLFDIPAKDADKWSIREEDLPGSIDFSDAADVNGERILDEAPISIYFGGVTVRPLRSSGDVPLFIDTRYLAPFINEMERLFLFRRTTPGGMDYIAAKTGMILAGVIPPVRIESERFVSELSKLAEDVKEAFAPEEDHGE